MPVAPELTQELANEIGLVARDQLALSRRFKTPRISQIKEWEDLYFNVVPKQMRNPFNESIPYVGGFVDHMLSKLDDVPNITFKHKDGADFKKAQRITAAFQNEKDSTDPDSMWALKDRYATKSALFTGRAYYKYFAENDSKEGYKSHFDVLDFNEFHFEPNGGGILENHLFCGEDTIFLTKEEVIENAQAGIFDHIQVQKLINNTPDTVYKENQDLEDRRDNKFRAFGLDIGSHNYVGQTVFRFAEWYLTYKGVRWQILFNDDSSTWVRIKLLSDVFKRNLYPYMSWATHEDLKVFTSKAPMDDAGPIGRLMNTFLNQELYNRQKRNYGQRAYDAQMFKDIEALANTRPDGLIPVDTKNGQRNVKNGIFEFSNGEVGGSIDLIHFLDSFAGQKTGSTPGSQGTAEEDKKVGIFFGELKQVEDRLNLHNKSKKEVWAQTGRRFQHGLEEHLDKMEIEIMGTDGVEWDEITREDTKTERSLGIIVKGGSDEEIETEIQNRKKVAILPALTTVNGKWKDIEGMRIAGYQEDEIKEAFDQSLFISKELMSEADQAIRMIVRGEKPEINRQANLAFIQRIVRKSKSLRLKDKKKEAKIATALLDYAISHGEIAGGNEAENTQELLRQNKLASIQQPVEGGAPVAPPTRKAPVSPETKVRSISQRLTNRITP